MTGTTRATRTFSSKSASTSARLTNFLEPLLYALDQFNRLFVLKQRAAFAGRNKKSGFRQLLQIGKLFVDGDARSVSPNLGTAKIFAANLRVRRKSIFEFR